MLTPSLPSLDSGGGFVYRSVAVVDCRLRGKPLRRDESGGAECAPGLGMITPFYLMRQEV